MAANQEPLGGGEAKFHGLFMLFLKLTGKTLSDVTQPTVLHPAFTLCGAPPPPVLCLDAAQRLFPRSKVVNENAYQNRPN